MKVNTMLLIVGLILSVGLAHAGEKPLALQMVNPDGIHNPKNDVAITNLSELGDAHSQVRAINNDSQVVGYSFETETDFNAFMYANGNLTTIGENNSANKKVYAINNHGVVTGSVMERHGKVAFKWSQQDGLIELGSLGGESTALAINDDGVVVGYSYLDGDKIYHAFMWDGKKMTDLGTLGGKHSTANDLNQKGQVVGQAMNENNGRRAFVWTAQNGMQELPTGSDELISGAMAINSAGQIAGFIITPVASTRAVLWQDGRMVELGTLGGNSSMAVDINSAGHVVGHAENADGKRHAFIWKNGKMIDLNTLVPSDSGWEFSEARAINDDGSVVGLGTYQGEESAFLINLSMFTAER